MKNLYSMNEQRFNTENSPSNGFTAVQRKRSRQHAVSLVKTGPLLTGNGGKDSLANSHRQANKNVKNARDVLKVADFKSEQKFEHYMSPASQQVRVTSAVGKRAISELREHTSGSNWSPSYKDKLQYNTTASNNLDEIAENRVKTEVGRVS